MPPVGPPMRNVLPWLLILLAVGLGYWLFATDPDDDAPAYDVGFEGDASVPPDLEATGLKGAKKPETDPKTKKPTKAWQPADPRTLARGVLIVRPLGPDLQPLVDRRLSIIVTPRGQRAAKLGLFDEETGAWRFERVIAGPVDLRVTGDHIIGRSVQTQVVRDQETEFELHLERAGAVKYDVVTYAKTRPDKVLVELFDAGGRPANAWFQERGPRKLTQPQKKRAHTQGPEGVLFGIRPGDYTLKVTNIETEEWDEGEIRVEAGKTIPLTLTVRR